MKRQSSFILKQLPIAGSILLLLGISTMPAVAAFSTDLAVTDIYPGKQPHGQFWFRLTNHGPGVIHNVHVDMNCSSERTDRNTGHVSSGGNRNFAVSLNLAPGKTKAFPTGLVLDTNVYDYKIRCHAKPGFHDPNGGNNIFSEALTATGGNVGGPGGGQFSTDIAITHIFAGNKPHGQFWVRITNHGHGTLNNVKMDVSCSAFPSHKQGYGTPVSHNKSFGVTLNLKPGQTGKYPTGISLDTNAFSYHVNCMAHPAFHDPNTGNNQHGVNIQ